MDVIGFLAKFIYIFIIRNRLQSILLIYFNVKFRYTGRGWPELIEGGGNVG